MPKLLNIMIDSEQPMFTKTIPLILFVTVFSACSSTPVSIMKTTEASEEKKPKEQPPKESETVWKCKISNGAGRIFQAIDESHDQSEAKARHQCEIYSKTCTFLSCTPISENEE